MVMSMDVLDLFSSAVTEIQALASWVSIAIALKIKKKNPHTKKGSTELFKQKC